MPQEICNPSDDNVIYEPPLIFDYLQAPICAHVNSTGALLSEIDNLGSQALRETNEWHLQVNNLEQMEDGGSRRNEEERKEWFCEAGARSRMAYNCGHVNHLQVTLPQSQLKWQLLQIYQQILGISF